MDRGVDTSVEVATPMDMDESNPFGLPPPPSPPASVRAPPSLAASPDRRDAAPLAPLSQGTQEASTAPALETKSQAMPRGKTRHVTRTPQWRLHQAWDGMRHTVRDQASIVVISMVVLLVMLLVCSTVNLVSGLVGPKRSKLATTGNSIVLATSVGLLGVVGYSAFRCGHQRVTYTTP